MLRRISKKAGLISTAALLSVLIVLSCVMPAVVSASQTSDDESVGGIVTSLATKEMKKFAYDLIDRTILAGLGRASSATENENVQKLLNATRKILGGGQGVANSKILNACAEIEQQLNELDATVRAASAHTDTMIAQLEKLITENTFAEQTAKLRDFSTKYLGVTGTFRTLSQCLKKYVSDSEDPTVTESTLMEDVSALGAAYSDVESYYTTATTVVEDIQSGSDDVNFYNDLNSYLLTISPYYPTEALADDITDKSLWGSAAQGAKTYLDYAMDYCDSNLVGENQVYDMMTACIGEAASHLITYFTAYQLFAEYDAYRINSDTGYCNDESKRQVALSSLMGKYEAAQKTGLRGIYQLVDLYQDELITMMRGYDMTQTFDMNFKKEEEHVVSTGLINDQVETLRSLKTYDTLEVQLIKPYGSANVYAVNRYEANRFDIYHQDSVYDVFYEDYTMSQDFYNLQSTDDSKKDKGFRVIKNGGELANLISRNAFQLSNNLLDVYLNDYGKMNALHSLADYRAKGADGAFAILDKSHYNVDKQKMTMLNVSYAIQGSPESSEVTLDLSSIKKNNSIYPLSVIMINNETISRTMSLESGGARVEAYNGGNKVMESGGSAAITSGTEVELHIYPDSGKVVDKVELVGANGRVKNTPYSSVMTATAAATNTEPQQSITYDVGDTLYQMDDGGYKLSVSAPYQNSTIKVSTKNDTTPDYHRVYLLNAQNGDLEFESHDGQSEMLFTPGETVTVYARPFDNNIVGSIRLIDANSTTANELDVKATEIDGQIYAPNERIYTFKMPAQDVFVEPYFKTDGVALLFDKSKYVYNNGTPICYLETSEGSLYTGWEDHPRYYAAGEEASFTAFTDEHHYLVSVKAIGANSGREYPLTIDNNVYCLTTDRDNPEDIKVIPEFGLLSSKYRVAIKDGADQKRELFFTDSEGNILTVDQSAFSEGENVVLTVTDDDIFTSPISVTDSKGEDVSELVPFTLDTEAKKISFTMIARNIVLTVPVYHNYVNGICRDCGHYETLDQGANGFYQIKNAGNLFWISALTRGDHSHATFDNTDSSPKFELVNDIDLESFNWEPIASSYDGDSFGGTFEGNGHTIDHFYLYRNITDFKTDNLYYGLFAHCEYATIQNFTIKGKAEIISHRPEGVSVSQGYDPVFGTVAGGTFFYSTLCDVYSYVDVSVEADDNSMSKAAGIVCFPGGEFNIQRCVNFGNITGDYMYAGGITILPMYPEGSIKDCANIGNMHSTLKYPDIENLISSGILVFVWNSIFFQDYLYMNMSDCYDYGTISGEPNMLCLPISTPITEMKNMTAENCYYIDAVTSPNDIGTPHTAEQFKSGETGYKLNSGVTDGTQAWYQNIDNGKTPDDYPLPDKSRGTIYYIESENRYSNYPDGNPPQPSTEPATVEPTTVEPTTVEPTTVEPTTVEPTTAEPTTEPTEPATVPDGESHGIQTYEELVAFMESVNSGKNYDSAYLGCNIIAPEDSEWTQGIGTSEKPFSGTFDGKGYGIIGLNVNCGENGGLFGVIGESGTVKDLMVIDCDFVSDSTYAGGIAAQNNGAIDHCTSGVNMPANLKIKLPSGKKIAPADYNSLIKGANAGGIAAVNNGTITGTRSGAFVSGGSCGGIAAQNNGRIFGCANNGAVGNTYKSCEKSGGLAADNSGSIEGSYNSGKVYCGNAANLGAIAGCNSSADVKKSFYSNLNSLAPVGSGTAVDSTCEMVTDDTMLTSSFVDTLNSATGETVTWRQSKYGDTYFNEGYPTIEGRFLQNRALTLLNGMTLSGMMHSSLQVTVSEADKDSEEYQALKQQAGGATVYNAVTTDENGSYIPAELWTAGGLTLSVPVNSAGAKLLTVNENNEIVTIEPDSVENGVAIFTVAAPNTFAVTDAAPQPAEATTQPAEETTPSATAKPQPSTNDAASSTKDSTAKDSSGSNGTVKTGESAPVLIVLVLMASFCSIMLIRRRRYIGK
ncbi:hypothetical protein SAMN02910436_02226 [Ruminococcaceae bacterium P7]|nr:hypothetical protein SAMN02910436_02226 [Ruminococcaceae bacterium P7]